MKRAPVAGLGIITGLTLLFMSTLNCSRKATGTEPPVATFPSHSIADDSDLDMLVQRIGESRIVLLGEASHGTSEYYNWRAAISKKLIEEKGFDFIAVEGEWADSYRVNNFIKGPLKDSAQSVALLKQYDRWPTWMWSNYEVASLVTWLNHYNQQKAAPDKAGFFGLDVYCLWESMTELMPYIQSAAPSLVNAATGVHQCFQPYSNNPEEYAWAVSRASVTCREQTNNLWESITRFTSAIPEKSINEFVMEQNALVALNGERYYSSMVSGNDQSWNIRDRHMAQTLDRLLDFHGPASKAIIWQHNTHVGDARYTDMAQAGMVNVGQLVREKYPDNVFIVGFGSYQGSVIAAESWGAPMQQMTVPPAAKSSWEYLLHHDKPGNKLLFSDEIKSHAAVQQPIGNRAIGVVYDPSHEQGNYVPSLIAKRYDAFFFIDQTTALHPITVTTRNEPPDTYPSGF